MPLTARGVQHILDVRKRSLAGRTSTIVRVSQLSAPTGMADPGAPVISDGGAGGTFPGGSVYAVCVAKNASGQTRAGAEAGPVSIAANHLLNIQPPVVAGATTFDVFVSLAPGSEALAGTTAAGAQLIISAPLPAGAAAPFNSYAAVQAIFRHQRGINPADLDESGTGGDRRLMEVMLEMAIDTDLSGVTMIANTATPTPDAVEAAPRYVFIDLVAAGMVPGGDRWLATLRRIR